MQHCNRYKGGDTGRGSSQLATTAGLFLLSCVAMWLSLRGGVIWPVIFLWLPTGGLLVRLFIIQHDCGHLSYFKTRKANDTTGRLLSLFTVTPYGFWRDTHNMHHAASGNLDARGIGSIDTLTVREYKALPPLPRLIYRLYRNPVIALLIGPPLHIMLIQRLPIRSTSIFLPGYKTVSTKKTWRSILGLDIALLFFYGGLSLIIGATNVALIFVAPVVTAAWIGGWLFYIQHQFENSYWAKTSEWNFQEAAVMGSSYYKLHPVLQWFTGNIGLHHIHHLCSLIPNYKLQECLDANEDLKKINVMTLHQSLRSIPLALWDESKKAMISFRQYERMRPTSAE
ncbi:MAG: fatty acid desaturase [Micavibrio aeruginosavorus]|uniref:Fatty acid desaturase n=1 Tax=Micavibrio aeruginosavorus TaxID=349221 RepID=A0A7T5R4L3_9BACT|nr:MAG: fatty acid desaturase [Micavibrio aeruginosavorus]